jgi:TetR/AcrR family transcriptional regulator, cholesterol catabolism regulator
VTAQPSFALHRRLTAGQQATRGQIIDAALAIAAEEGYDALTTRTVAARAGVAIGTVYRYFTSKDHILVEAMFDWSTRFERSVVENPPVGATPAERVAEVFDRFSSRSSRRPLLAAAMVRAAASSDLTVIALRGDQRSVTSRLVELAIGDAEIPDRDDVLAVFEDVAFASTLNTNDTSSSIGEHMRRAARVLLRDRSDEAEMGVDLR